MLSGNFREAKQDKIELKLDNSHAIFEFLKLLYPRNVLHGASGKVVVNEKNILDILQLADKYAAINIIM